jgi:hypothetical protein
MFLIILAQLLLPYETLFNTGWYSPDTFNLPSEIRQCDEDCSYIAAYGNSSYGVLLTNPPQQPANGDGTLTICYQSSSMLFMDAYIRTEESEYVYVGRCYPHGSFPYGDWHTEHLTISGDLGSWSNCAVYITLLQGSGDRTLVSYIGLEVPNTGTIEAD